MTMMDGNLRKIFEIIQMKERITPVKKIVSRKPSVIEKTV